MVGLGGLEPPTSPLSGVRSSQAELQTQMNSTCINFEHVSSNKKVQNY